MKDKISRMAGKDNLRSELFRVERTSGQILLDQITAEAEAKGFKSGIQIALLLINNDPNLSTEDLFLKLNRILEEDK